MSDVVGDFGVGFDGRGEGGAGGVLVIRFVVMGMWGSGMEEEIRKGKGSVPKADSRDGGREEDGKAHFFFFLLIWFDLT